MRWLDRRLVAWPLGFLWGLSFVAGRAGDPVRTIGIPSSIPKIYWTSLFGPPVRRSSLDGSASETVLSTGGAYGLAVDSQHGKIYWSDVHELDIRCANLDGTDIRVVVPRGVTVNPLDIDLSPQEGKIYWTDEFSPIRRADLDGSHLEDLVPTSHATGMALDVPNGKMYWEELSGTIRRANLDGSDEEVLVPWEFGAILPIGLALDPNHGKIYWADLGNDKIVRANLDGSEVENVVTSLPNAAFNPAGIAVDPNGGKIYWDASGPLPDRHWVLQRANLDGSDAETILVSELYDEVMEDIEFVDVPLQVLQPNGGEGVPSGSSYQIRWQTPSGASSCQLGFSRDGGATWRKIAQETSGTIYDWQVPRPRRNLSNLLVRVRAYDRMNREVGVDVSDGPFEVTVLRLTDPSGGEVLSSGDVHMIRWETHGTAAPVATVRLFLSLDAGASWTRIAKIRSPNPGFYGWQVPTLAAVENRCRIKVVLTDGSDGRLGKDESDALFTIRPPSG